MVRAQFNLRALFLAIAIIAAILATARLNYSMRILLAASLSPIALVCLPAMWIGIKWWRNHADRRFSGIVLFLCAAVFWAAFTLDRADDLVDAARFPY